MVVGISGTGTVGTRAFLWTSDAGVRDLNPLLSQGLALILAGALDINDSGWILAFGSEEQEVMSDSTLEHGLHASPNRIFLLTLNTP